jgi:hypothetical protein
VSAAPALDRAFTTLWLAYPLMLFSMPNEVRIGGFPPETLVAACFLLVVMLSVIVASAPVRLLELPDQVPFYVLLFFAGVLFATGFKGEAALLIRVVSWGAVLLIATVLFRDPGLRASLWKVWFVVGVGTALYSMAVHGFAWPEEVNILAWTHRTVLGYFLGMSLLLGIYLSAQARTANRALFLCGAGICGLALVASMARGAWLFAIAGMLIQMRAGGSRIRLGPMLAVLAVVVTAAVMLGAPGIAERARSIVDLDQASSTLYRANLYLATARSLPETWLVGAPTLDVGPYIAQFSIIRYPFLFSPEFATDSDLIHLTLLGGLPLLAILGVALLKLGLRLWRDMKASGSFDPRLWLLLLLGAQLALDNVFSSALGWFYLGILCTVVPPPPAPVATRVTA